MFILKHVLAHEFSMVFVSHEAYLFAFTAILKSLCLDRSFVTFYVDSFYSHKIYIEEPTLRPADSYRKVATLY